MRRTQLYLDDHLWDTLHLQAKAQHTTISELVRQAVRDRYLSNNQARIKAMRDFIGSRETPPGAPSAQEEVRRLRKGTRMERIRNR